MLEPSRELDTIAGAVIGAALEVHRILGPGFPENVYEHALEIELDSRRVSFDRQKSVEVSYKGRTVGVGKFDFLVGKSLIAELKAAERLLPVHHAQVISYLKATGCRLGLLINFHENQLRQGLKRIVLTASALASVQFTAKTPKSNQDKTNSSYSIVLS
ncbi:MAG: GxxExxY protein [Burkholderiales bacterium]